MHSDFDESVYAEVRRIVYQQSGISLGPGKQALVQARLGKRLRALRMSSYREYLDYLLSDHSGDELVHLLDVISTNHTFFFREPDHFRLLEDYLSGLLRRGQRRLRIWCAAASSGEEPYTISMVAQDICAGFQADLRILATDISTRVLSACLCGEYPDVKIQDIPEPLRRKWWEQIDEQTWRAKSSLRRPLTFARMNLMETPYPMRGPFDAIFCRNVMIYFDRAGREKIVDEFRRLLQPGSLLIVGHSETLAGIGHGFRAIKPSVYERVR